MAKQLTIRGVSAELGRRLKRLAEARGESVNATALALLEAAVGTSERRERLLRYATWTQEDVDRFDEALASQRVVDDELWQ